jgi:hypothetical protein
MSAWAEDICRLNESSVRVHQMLQYFSEHNNVEEIALEGCSELDLFYITDDHALAEASGTHGCLPVDLDGCYSAPTLLECLGDVASGGTYLKHSLVWAREHDDLRWLTTLVQDVHLGGVSQRARGHSPCLLRGCMLWCIFKMEIARAQSPPVCQLFCRL